MILHGKASPILLPTSLLTHTTNGQPPSNLEPRPHRLRIGTSAAHYLQVRLMLLLGRLELSNQPRKRTPNVLAAETRSKPFHLQQATRSKLLHPRNHHSLASLARTTSAEHLPYSYC